MDDRNEKKVSYTKSAIYAAKDDGELANKLMVVEGFAKKLTVRTVDTKNGEKTVADITISAILPEKRVERNLGPEYLNDFHSVSFRITYWGYAAEHLAQYSPQKNQKVTCFIHKLKKNEYEGERGTYYSVDATGIDFPWTSSARKADGEPLIGAASNASSGGGSSYNRKSSYSSNAGNSSDYGSASKPSGFMELDDGDEELPF